MEQQHLEVPPKHHELHQKRMDLHGNRRKLHDRLTEVCEGFILEDMSRKYKHNTLVRELEYLVNYYRDEENWQGID